MEEPAASSHEFDNSAERKLCFLRLWRREDLTYYAHCADLTVEQVEALRQEAIGWRDLEFRLPRTHRLAREFGYKGVVLLIESSANMQAPFQVPPPVTVWFEPVKLNDADRQLRALLDQASSQSGIPIKRRYAGIIQRWFVRSTTALVLIYVLGMLNMAPLTALNSAAVLSRVGPFLLIMIAILIGSVLCQLAVAHWYLIPGGLAVRGWTLRPGVPAGARYTASDDALQIEHINFGYTVTLSRPGRTVMRRMTHMEVVALLAVWQSPLTPPSEDVIRKLW